MLSKMHLTIVCIFTSFHLIQICIAESFYYEPLDDPDHQRPLSMHHHNSDLEKLYKQGLIPHHMRRRRTADTKHLCRYAEISRKITTCFLTQPNCSAIVTCITESRLVETCGHYGLYTPSVWILNVFELLQTKNFCENSELGCMTFGWGIGRNESLEKLNDVMKAMHKYGTEFLDSPKSQTKVYCTKSLSLVNSVKSIFDELDQCSFNEVYDEILNGISSSSGQVLNKDCSYCITENSIFESCLMDYWGNENNCSTTRDCIYQKINLYGCNRDENVTPLTLLSAFLTNVSSICEMEKNKTEGKFSFVTVEWFRELDYCVQGKQFLGLTFEQAPADINVCQSMEETFKCIHQTLHDFRFIDKPLFKTQFAKFANQYNRMQRKCDLLSIHRVATKAQIQESERHSFVSNEKQEVFEDNKLYYHQTVVWPTQGQLINWIDINGPEYERFHVNNDQDLSRNYLKATVVNLRFTFPFYGHLLNRIVVATGGFIYVGSIMNSLITKSQYIAPLMGNFDPALSRNTAIKYVDNSTHFICTWEKIILKDQPKNGEYTFQAILSNTGKITFNYKTIPSQIITTANHEVKVGLSDAYINFNLLTASKLEYRIVQYHRLNVSLEAVKSGNSIMLFMLLNCIQLDTCSTCLQGAPGFTCMWCPVLQRCSDTLDRYRQEWMQASCPSEKPENQSCQALAQPRLLLSKFQRQATTDVKVGDYVKAILIGVFSTLMISMLVILGGWVYYAYNHPTSSSGIWLIEHRPSKIIPMLSFNLKRETATATRFENPE